MIKNNLVIWIKYTFIILTLFFFSCEDQTVLIFDPNENSSVEYDFRIFNLDVENSGTIREGDTDFEGEENIDYQSLDLYNSGLSSRLYLGVIDNNAEYNDGELVTEENPSYVYIKIKNSLIKNNFFCDDLEDLRALNKIDLKIPTLTNTEDLYSSQYYDFNDLIDCSSLDDEDECNDYSNCFWYEQIDDMGDIQIESCETYYIYDSVDDIPEGQSQQINQDFLNNSSTNLGGDPGDYENVGSHYLKAYIISDSNEIAGLENYSEDSEMNHDPDVFLAEFQGADEVPISISGTNDFISIDLRGHLYSLYTQEDIDDTLCSSFNYEDCACLVSDGYVCEETGEECQVNSDCSSGNTCDEVENGRQCSHDNSPCEDNYDCNGWIINNCVLSCSQINNCENQICSHNNSSCSNDNDCNLREECYWTWDVGACIEGLCDNNGLECESHSDCMPTSGTCQNASNYIYNDGFTVAQGFCEGNNDIHLLLEYSSLSEIPSNQMIELYSTDEDFLYNNPYLYLNYHKIEQENVEVDKYVINSITDIQNDCIEGTCLYDFNVQCEDDSDCEESPMIYNCGGSGNCGNFDSGYENLKCMSYEEVSTSTCAGINDGKSRCSNNCSECEEDSDCINYDSLGMILAQSNYFDVYFDVCNENGTCNSSPDIACTTDTDCFGDCEIIFDSDECNDTSNCLWDENTNPESCIMKPIEPIIKEGFEAELFKYEISLEDVYNYTDYNGDSQSENLEYDEIVFNFNNDYGEIGFIYVEDDPSNDNWQDCGSDGDCLLNISDETQGNGNWDEGENIEGNEQWDCGGDTLEECEYVYNNYEKFDDFGQDQCQDIYEKGNKWLNDTCYNVNDVLNENPIQGLDENTCLCTENICVDNLCTYNQSTCDNDSDCQYIENSIYNPYGLENNFQLDWFDLDEDGEWDECDGIFCEGEKWYNYGFDHVQDNFESGCFNDDVNPYGSNIIYWNYEESNSWEEHLNQPDPMPDIISNGQYSYQELLNVWLSLEENQGKDINDLDDYTFYIGDSEITICGGIHWNEECNSQSCTLNDPNGDNFNIDPFADNFDQENNINGTEDNYKWDGAINNDGTMCQVNDCELFHDFGLDGLNDDYEFFNYEIEDDNHDIESATDLPENSIYLSGNEIWYNINFNIKSYSFLLPCAEVTSVSDDSQIAYTQNSGSEISNTNFEQTNNFGSLLTLSFCENYSQDDCEVNEFCRWDDECIINSLQPTGIKNINFIDVNDDVQTVEFYYKTQNNGRWDWVDMNDNCEFDEQLDLHEQFFDKGLDRLESDDEISENGEKYNSSGLENNNNVNDIYLDYFEKFDDFGLDGMHDSNEDGSTNDNYNIDPNEDNYDEEFNINGMENNGELDWADCGADGECIEDFCNIDTCDENNFCTNNQDTPCENDIDCGNCNINQNQLCNSDDDCTIEDADGTENNGKWDEGEQILERWYDWGYDRIENEDENNYMGDYALVQLGDNNSFTLDLDEFGNPTFSEDIPADIGPQVYMWISRIERIEDSNNYNIYVKIKSLVDIIAFQFQLTHVKESLEITDESSNSLFMYPHEFVDSDGDRFPDISPINELVSGGEKYIEDASIYKLVEEYDNSKLRTNYGQGLKSVLNFSDNSNSDFSFEQFVFDNPNSIISDQNTKLILYFNTSSPEHHINDRVNFTLEYYDSALNENIIFYDYYISNYYIYSGVDSLQIDIAPLIQKYVVGEIDYNNITIGSSSAYNNFSNVFIINDDEKYNPRLEVFYSK